MDLFNFFSLIAHHVFFLENMVISWPPCRKIFEPNIKCAFIIYHIFGNYKQTIFIILINIDGRVSTFSKCASYKDWRRFLSSSHWYNCWWRSQESVNPKKRQDNDIQKNGLFNYIKIFSCILNKLHYFSKDCVRN